MIENDNINDDDKYENDNDVVNVNNEYKHQE